MEIQDEEVSTEEPQLRYWNPWRRGRSVFTATPTRPAPTVSPIHIVKMGAQPNAYCDDTQYTCLPSSVFDNQQPLNQDLFQSNGESSTQDLSSAGNEPNSSGLNIYIPLETVTPETTSLLLPDQVEDLKENIIKLEPEEFDDRFGPDPKDDILTFNSIDEALDSIDSPSIPDANFSALSLQPSGNRMSLTSEKQEEVVKAAKSLFSKRTRTLYHWLFPDTSKNKLKATVSAAWETLSEGEKHFYISQVLGRFGLQASSLMVNPQLGGMKCIPNEIEHKNEKKKSRPIEDQRAVDSLFDSCEDAGNWASFSEPKEQKPVIKVKPERRHRRKRQKSQKDVNDGTPDAVTCIKEEKGTKNQKKPKKVHEEVQDFEEDPELTRELEKFRLITEAAEEDIWGDIPDPEELFADINF